MSITNYDQAWSMVHFLAHGDDGKYTQAFESYMRLVGRGRPSEVAWNSIFGSNTAAFEKQWRAWWTNLPDDPTSELYARATVATLTSFLTRAADQQQSFDSFDDFDKAAESGTLKCGDAEWLPLSLLNNALRDLAHRQESGEKFSFPSGPGRHPPEIIDQTIDGLRIIGDGDIRNGRVSQVTVRIVGQKHPATQPAKANSTIQTAGRDATGVASR
ncbi:MAG: hypothetical protein JO353_03115 [Phycisphaerae bacterium]|nr:hypothetical protein [Phycisphaerae bacterium]